MNQSSLEKQIIPELWQKKGQMNPKRLHVPKAKSAQRIMGSINKIQKPGRSDS